MFAQCCIQSATLVGVTAVPVQVEVVVESGLPGFTIVGMTDAAIQEARERIRAALRSSGFIFPGIKVVVNLAPGSLKKRGSGFDLPIALAILIATGQINPHYAEESLFVGELSLDGSIRSVPGLLAYALEARTLGYKLVCADAGELGLGGVANSTRIVKHLADFANGCFSSHEDECWMGETANLDFADIAGHDRAKRALQIAAAGNHGVLLAGVPGGGKTMLASRLPSILPPLSEEEQLESAVIHSVAGEGIDQLVCGIRPFRSPHHSASLAGLVGGGTPIRPGEISLAHNGVLFLDELPEFKPSVLQGLRQPMESGSITLVHAEQTVELPARFSLIAAANPCPCGHYGDKEQKCICSPTQIANYHNRIGGPVLDRIDMRVDVCRLPAFNVLSAGTGKTSSEMREEVLIGRAYKEWREQRDPQCVKSESSLLKWCNVEESALKAFEKRAQMHHLSGRSITRILTVARTIADMAESDQIRDEHLCEALGYKLQEMM